MNYFTLPMAFIVAIFGIIVLSGKGDGLIAGYNTASPEEKKKVNIQRLRLVVGITLLAVAVLVALIPYLGQIVFLLCFFPILIACLVLSNTWCIKK